jgi:small subunit ribosomal protein S20
MANTPQSEKRARQAQARFAVNKMRRSRIRTFLRKVEEAIASGDNAAAREALRLAQPELMRGVSKGVVKKNTASRKMSRLAARVKATGASARPRPPDRRSPRHSKGRPTGARPFLLSGFALRPRFPAAK